MDLNAFLVFAKLEHERHTITQRIFATSSVFSVRYSFGNFLFTYQFDHFLQNLSQPNDRDWVRWREVVSWLIRSTFESKQQEMWKHVVTKGSEQCSRKNKWQRRWVLGFKHTRESFWYSTQSSYLENSSVCVFDRCFRTQIKRCEISFSFLDGWLSTLVNRLG